MQQRATIHDVARRSGVSVATVSRAMRGLPNVSPATRRRVLAAASDLRYSPDPNAARLAAGKTGTLAVIVPSIPIWYSAQVMAGVEAVVTSEGFDFVVVVAGDAASREHVLGERNWLDRRCDGAVLVDLVPGENRWRSVRVPLTVAGARVEGFDSVWVDNVEGGRMAARRLLEAGHRRIGIISGARDQLGNHVTEDRRRGFLEELERHHVRFEAGLEQVGVIVDADLEQRGDYSALGGHEAMNRLLALGSPPTAVFAMSDEMALGAMRAIVEAGLRVPEDMSVMGFDDHELAFTCGLTTIGQDPARMGTEAARILVERLAGLDEPALDVEQPLSLVERSSVGALSSPF